MNIFDLMTSAPDEAHILLVALLFIVAAILFSLAVANGLHPSARNMARTAFSADYWISRQNRKNLYCRDTKARNTTRQASSQPTLLCTCVDKSHNGAPGNKGANNPVEQPTAGGYPQACM